jgi:hypothetical protein
MMKQTQAVPPQTNPHLPATFHPVGLSNCEATFEVSNTSYEVVGLTVDAGDLAYVVSASSDTSA